MTAFFKRPDFTRMKKGQMMRWIVADCLHAGKITLAWAMAIKTLAVILDRQVDLSDILIFAAAMFGGELIVTALKRIFAKERPAADGGGEEGGEL
jgi:hypothetical protein